MTIKEFKIQYALGSLSTNTKINLADNPNTPKGILTKLSTDEFWYIRWQIAQNLNTPSKTLSILSKDIHKNIRCNVAYNPNTPIAALKKLSTDLYDSVRRGAKKTLRKENKNG